MARRKCTHTCNEENWIEYQKATNQKKGTIKRVKTVGWKAIISEATEESTKIWKLAKWAKKSYEDKDMPALIPDIKGCDENTALEIKEKVTIMAFHFFPKPAQANTNDIAGTRYAEEIDIIFILSPKMKSISLSENCRTIKPSAQMEYLTEF